MARRAQNPKTSRTLYAAAAAAHLNLTMPPLLTSKARKEVEGRPSAVHSNARRMLLCVTTRCIVPGASSTSACKRRGEC